VVEISYPAAIISIIIGICGFCIYHLYWEKYILPKKVDKYLNKLVKYVNSTKGEWK
jgi:hypothetical protein